MLCKIDVVDRYANFFSKNWILSGLKNNLKKCKIWIYLNFYLAIVHICTPLCFFIQLFSSGAFLSCWFKISLNYCYLKCAKFFWFQSCFLGKFFCHAFIFVNLSSCVIIFNTSSIYLRWKGIYKNEFCEKNYYFETPLVLLYHFSSVIDIYSQRGYNGFV